MGGSAISIRALADDLCSVECASAGLGDLMRRASDDWDRPGSFGHPEKPNFDRDFVQLGREYAYATIKPGQLSFAL